jgi:hypothetical protein
MLEGVGKTDGTAPVVQHEREVAEVKVVKEGV